MNFELLYFQPRFTSVKSCLVMAAYVITISLNILVAPELMGDLHLPNSVEGWQADAGTTVNQKDGFIEIWSAKQTAGVSRKVKISEGFKVLSGKGSPNIQIIIKNESRKPVVCRTDYGGDSRIRAGWTDFRATGEEVTLRVQADVKSQPGTFGNIQIVGAPINKTDWTPTPKELAGQRPHPWPGRGFMTANVTSDKPSLQDFKDMREWGANIVRLQINPLARAKALSGKAVLDPDVFWQVWPTIVSEIEQAVVRAGSCGLKSVLDLHVAPMPGIGGDKIWESDDLQANFCRAWTDIAKKLLPHKEVIWAYDIYNEPLDRSQLPWAPKNWYALAVEVVKAVRSVDPDVWMVYEVGPGSLFRGFEGLSPLPDTHIIYSAHFYTPQEFTHQGIENIAGTDLAEAMKQVNVRYSSKTGRGQLEAAVRLADEFERKWSVPIFIGEFSVIRWAPKEDAAEWLSDAIDLFEQRKWSYTYHAFREFPGWSLEHDEDMWVEGGPPAKLAKSETLRAKIIREAFKRNSDSK